MKVNNKYLIYGTFILVVSIAIMAVPILIDFFVIGNNFPSNISNSDWVGFLGSYIGSLIGSIATLVGIIVTLRFTKEQSNYERNFQQLQTNEDRRLLLAPYLKYNMIKTKCDIKHDINILQVIDEDYNTYANATISIKNIGMGPLLDFKIDNITFKDVKLNFTIDGSNDVLEKDSEWFMLIDLRFKLDEIRSDELIENQPGSLVKFSAPLKYLNKGGTLCFNIGYKDLLSNQYEQDLKISMSIALEGDKTGLKWKYTNPELRIDRVGKSKIAK